MKKMKVVMTDLRKKNVFLFHRTPTFAMLTTAKSKINIVTIYRLLTCRGCPDGRPLAGSVGFRSAR